MQRDLTIDPEVFQALAVAAELSGTTLSEAAAVQLAKDMSKYPTAWVLGAVERFRMEARSGTRLTPSELIQRLPDGRPSPDEAWAMLPRDEASTVVWCEEMRIAWAAAKPLMGKQYEINAARTAFIEAYRAQVMSARVSGKSVRWSASLGSDVRLREQALSAAVEQGRMSMSTALKLAPSLEYQQSKPLLENKGAPQLPAPDAGKPVGRHMDEIRRMLEACRKRVEDAEAGIQDVKGAKRDAPDA